MGVVDEADGQARGGAAVADVSERFALLVDAVQEYAIFLMDPVGTVVTWNPGAQRLKGYSSEEVVGQSFEIFYPEQDQRAGKPAAELDQARRLGSLTDDGWRVRRDGTRFWAHVVITALYDEDGNLTGFAKVTRDDSASRAAREREAALEEIASGLLEGSSATQALDLLVNRAGKLVGAAGTWVITTCPVDPAALEVVAADGEIAPPVGTVFPRQGTVSERVMTTGQPATVADLQSESSARAWVAGHGSALVVPLVAGEASLGVLTASTPAGGPILDEAHLEVLRAFAREAAVVLAYQQLQEGLRAQQRIEDRARIARDLHDHVIQLVFAAGMTVQSVASQSAEPSVRGVLDGVVDQLDEAIRQLRTAVFELQLTGHPEGLRQAMLTLCREAARPLGFQPAVRFTGPIDAAVPTNVTKHALAAVREMLSNVARHAQATTATVTVTADKSLIIAVTDDGIGPPRAATAGTGLSNLTDRAGALGGTFTLEPAPGGGSRARWRAPLTR